MIKLYCPKFFCCSILLELPFLQIFCNIRYKEKESLTRLLCLISIGNHDRGVILFYFWEVTVNRIYVIVQWRENIYGGFTYKHLFLDFKNPNRSISVVPLSTWLHLKSSENQLSVYQNHMLLFSLDLRAEINIS